MFKTKTSIPMVFLWLIFINSKETENCDVCSKPYEPPGNIKFPYGDENQIDVDVADNDTNTILCSDKLKLMPEHGRCPFPPEDPGDMPLTNPYVNCPPFPELIPPGNVVLGEPAPPSKVQCKSCDIKLTEDDMAVLLKCIDCYDLPSTERTANYTETELLYKVYFIEIANYTSVDVQGKENF